LILHQHRRVQEQLVAGAVELGELDTERHDDADGRFEVELGAARPQLFESGTERARRYGSADWEGRD
jgi:hypothetical protein